MTRLLNGLVLICAVFGAAPAAHADDGAQKVRDAIAAQDPTLKIESVEKSHIAGLYRIAIEGSSGYVTADGRYIILGDLYDLTNRRNLTEDSRRQQRLDALASVAPESAIVFAPPAPRHTITVFTDVDCGFCRKLHSEIAQYNERGIAVRYVAFPRNGPQSGSWNTMRAVWCSTDRRDALTRAKRGEKLQPSESCATQDVATQYALGQRLGVAGTPTMVLEDGSVIGGYVTADELAQRLDQNQGAKTAQQR